MTDRDAGLRTNVALGLDALASRRIDCFMVVLRDGRTVIFRREPDAERSRQKPRRAE